MPVDLFSFFTIKTAQALNIVKKLTNVLLLLVQPGS